MPSRRTSAKSAPGKRPSSRGPPPKEASASPTVAAPPRPRHRLVPVHELLSREESERTLKELRISSDRLPKILLQDPGLETDPTFLRAREAKEDLVGRLVRIRRPSPTAGEAVAYRVIIAQSSE
jgi:DNA-directed RNA polymerase subunit H